jgi:hypothetical protein
MWADDRGLVVSGRSGPNLRAIRKTARRLRAEERTDSVSEALLVLLHSSAGLADLVTSGDPTNDVPVYARTKALAAHGTLLRQLADIVAPLNGDSAVDALLAELVQPGPGVTDVREDPGDGRL